MRLLRTKRQRQFMIAYVVWALLVFLLYWTEPYATQDRWTIFRWMMVLPVVVFAAVWTRDLLAAGADAYRAVRGWVNRGV